MGPFQMPLEQVLADERLIFTWGTDSADERPSTGVAGFMALAFILAEESHRATEPRLIRSGIAHVESNLPNATDKQPLIHMRTNMNEDVVSPLVLLCASIDVAAIVVE